MPAESNILYDTENAIFKLSYAAVMETLFASITSNNVPDDKLLHTYLERSSANGSKDVTLTSNAEGDYIARVSYILIDLLCAGKGMAYCKQCGREYTATELTIHKVTPFTRNQVLRQGVMDRLKSLLSSNRPINMPGMGGTTVTCPNQHELIQTIDWMT